MFHFLKKLEKEKERKKRKKEKAKEKGGKRVSDGFPLLCWVSIAIGRMFLMSFCSCLPEHLNSANWIALPETNDSAHMYSFVKRLGDIFLIPTTYSLSTMLLPGQFYTSITVTNVLVSSGNRRGGGVLSLAGF